MLLDTSAAAIFAAGLMRLRKLAVSSLGIDATMGIDARLDSTPLQKSCTVVNPWRSARLRGGFAGATTVTWPGAVPRMGASSPPTFTWTPPSSVGRFWLGFRPRSIAGGWQPAPVMVYRPPPTIALASPLKSFEIPSTVTAGGVGALNLTTSATL
jgi:hypothetical protein